jgi:hypothetical protein
MRAGTARSTKPSVRNAMAQVRAKVEHLFRVIKRQFSYTLEYG